jgi:uncharacterized membrane protein YdjX (TVP38/TMEM64 family)
MSGDAMAAGGSKSATRRAGPLVKIALGLLLVALLVLAGRSVGAYLEEFAGWVERLGAWGPIVFIAGYVLACVAFVPGAVLTLAAGILFGLVRGVAYVLVGAVLGSSAAFLVSRYLARRAVERRIQADARFAAIDRAIAKEGLKIVFLLRLSPLFPFNLLNYGLGLTQVRFRDYLLASAGMIPGTVLYVYYGTALGSLARLAAGARPAGGPAGTAVFVAGLLATLGATYVVTRIARQALARSTGDVP